MNGIQACTEIRIRGYHADAYGHVNNARYLEFLEEDRWALLERTGCLEKINNAYVFLTVNISINYRKAIIVGCTVQVFTALERVGNKSIALRQKIVFKETGDVAADAVVTFVVQDKRGDTLVVEGELLDLVKKLAD